MDTRRTTPARARTGPDLPSPVFPSRLALRHFFVGIAIACCVFALARGTVYAGNPDFDRPFGDISDMPGLVKKIMQFGIVLCIVAAAIYISIGAYAYFAAAGNAAMVTQGQAIIQRSVIGLVLALIAWVILNTISPQFTELKQSAVGGQQQRPVP